MKERERERERVRGEILSFYDFSSLLSLSFTITLCYHHALILTYLDACFIIWKKMGGENERERKLITLFMYFF